MTSQGVLRKEGMESLVDYYLDVPYAALNPLQAFDAYILVQLHQKQDAVGLICLIHGGAWRTGDKSDLSSLALNLATSTGCPVVVPNYRLTPKEPTADHFLHHPAHAQDILQFLEFILAWHRGNGGHLPRRPSKLFIIGYSCSAHMLCTIFMRMRRGSDAESVRPSDELVRSTASIIMCEGIYDVDLLLSDFPTYRAWFIENTFGRRDSFQDVSATKATVDPRGQHIPWFIIHSKGDTMVNERQSQEMHDFLKAKSCFVSKSFDKLHSDHEDVLEDPDYTQMIQRHIKDVIGA